MKKSIKIVSILMLVLMMASVTLPVFATGTKGTDIGGIIIDPSYNANANTTAKFNNVLGLIKYLGVFLAVGILMFLGIKYMMGSAEEKAEYKKTMIPFVIGVVLLFAAALIIQIIQSTTMSIL